jgi:protein-S-isoprenylcysteine O-methyltransferase Ste14
MNQGTDSSKAIIRPPVALAIAFVAALAIDWLYPLPFVPAAIPRALVGGVLFTLAFALAVWAIVTFSKAGTRVETYRPTTAIATSGPYRFTRNPIYLGMMLGLTGLAIGFDSLWILFALLPFYLVIRYGVIAREEAYLEGKFGSVYLDYKSRVRRWL